MSEKKSALDYFPRDLTHGPVPGTPDYDLFIDDQLSIINAEYLRSAQKLTAVADDIFVEVGKCTAALVNAVMPGKPLRVLDICCGIGLATETFLALGLPIASLTLTEQDQRLLDRAVAYLDEKGNRSKIGTLRTAVFEPNVHRLADRVPGEFDLVVTCNAFQHFSCELQKTLTEDIHRQLSEHGVLVLQSHWKTHEPNWRQAIVDDMKSQMRSMNAPAEFWERSIRHVSRYHNFVSSSDLLDWCREAGFGVVDVLFRKHIIGIVGAVK